MTWIVMFLAESDISNRAYRKRRLWNVIFDDPTTASSQKIKSAFRNENEKKKIFKKIPFLSLKEKPDE